MDLAHSPVPVSYTHLGNAADNRTGYGADKGGELADEGAHNGQHSCSRNHAHALYTGDCHDSDILAIGGGGHRAYQS